MPLLERFEDRLVPSFTTGSLVEISNPDPLANFPPGPRGAGVMTEPYVSVNPANPKNMAAIWIDDGYAGNVAGLTFDGSPSRGSRRIRAAAISLSQTPGSPSLPTGICTPAA